MIRTLTFKANGHRALVADGDAVTICEFDGMEPYATNLGIIPRCGTCAGKLDFTLTDEAVIVKEPCPYPDGITTVINLEVPSGKLIVTDDLRPVYNWDDNDIADYNTALGQHQAILAMAAQGCAYGPVGNTCPSLYQTGDDAYVIASLEYDEDTDEAILPSGWKELAGVCTDLWAYSIADFDHWVSRGGDSGSLDWTLSSVEVPAGTYQFTHHTGERSFDQYAPGTVIFADIKRVDSS